MAVAPSDVTQLLLSWQEGDAEALERLLPLVYAELHRFAHARMQGEWARQTLQTTALVHEAYLRLVDGPRVPWTNRAHFFAVCARLMRRILVDRARARQSQKRGGEARPICLGDWMGAQPADDEEVLALDEVLDTAGGTRYAPEQGRRAALLRRAHGGRSCCGLGHVVGDRHTRLEGGAPATCGVATGAGWK